MHGRPEVLERCRMEIHLAGDLDTGCHLGQLEGDRLVLDDRLAECRRGRGRRPAPHRGPLAQRRRIARRLRCVRCPAPTGRSSAPRRAPRACPRREPRAGRAPPGRYRWCDGRASSRGARRDSRARACASGSRRSPPCRRAHRSAQRSLRGSAVSPQVTKFLVPLMTYRSPAASARVWMLAASEPASGSVRGTLHAPCRWRRGAGISPSGSACRRRALRHSRASWSRP